MDEKRIIARDGIGGARRSLINSPLQRLLFMVPTTGM